MTDKNDKLVRQFLMENRQQIPDDGFTKRVMQSLPDESSLVLSRYWTILCWCVGVVVVCLLVMTGHIRVSVQLPPFVIRMITDLQSPAFVSHFLLANIGDALLLWGIILAGAFTFVYKQIKTI